MSPYQLQSAQPIGIFDSGVGGLTVVKEIIRTVPKESFVYFGDTARVPYGEKSGDRIIQYALESARFLAQREIKLLVVACNTVSAYALEQLEQYLQVPVIGTIVPGAAAAARVAKKRVAVLGTRATIHSHMFQKEIHKLRPDLEIIEHACPLFVPLIEESFASHKATKLIVNEYLAPLKKQNIDTILLGCTHYPILRSLIEEYFSNGNSDKNIFIVNPAETCSERVKHALATTESISQQDALPFHEYFVSGEAAKFAKIGQLLLGHPIKNLIGDIDPAALQTMDVK